MDLITSFQTAAPEAIAIGFALLGVLAGAILGDRASDLITRAAVLALVGAGVASLAGMWGGRVEAFGGVYVATDLLRVIKGVVYFLAAGALAMGLGFLRSERLLRYEYALLVVLATAGAGVMLSASDLTVFYLGLELLSISSYVLAAFNRDSQRSAEAGLKYFVLGALASGLMLYGMSLIYGFAGSTDFEAIAAADASTGLMFGVVLLVCGLAFKASAAPFHMWVPDVYQGAPSAVVAFFATAPKVAAVMVFAGLMLGPFQSKAALWQDVVAIIAAASMVVGALGALTQNNVKRLLAYSSVANVGFALIGVAAASSQGYRAALIYMMIYGLTSLGLFAAVLSMRRSDGMVETVADLGGLARTRPGFAVAISALLLSVGGIPPLFGFLGKWVVFEAGLTSGLTWLVLVGAVAAVVSLGYYLRLLKTIWIDPTAHTFERAPAGVTLALSGTAVVAVAGLAVLAGPITRLGGQLLP